MLQPRELEREIDKSFYEEHEGLNKRYNFYIRYGVVNGVSTKTVLYGNRYQTVHIINIQDSHKEYYPWDLTSIFKPEMLDRVKLVEIDGNNHYGYYVNIDTLQFSNNQYGHISGNLTNIVSVLPTVENTPTMMPDQKLFRGFYDNYLKFANGYIQLINSVKNFDPSVLNELGFDKTSVSGSCLIMSNESLDNELIRKIQIVKDDSEFDFYDRTSENDDDRFEQGENSFIYNKNNKPSTFNLFHDDGGILLIADAIRFVSKQGELNIQNAVLGQNLFTWLTNLTVYLEQMNKQMELLRNYITSVKTKQENDMQTIIDWISINFANHIHPAIGSPPILSMSPQPSTPVSEISTFDKENRNLFGTLRDKVSTILSKVFGLN